MTRTHLKSMLQAAFSDIFSAPQGATRKVYPLVLRRRCNAAERENSENPKGYGQFHLSLCRFGLGVSRDTPSSSLLASAEIGSYRG